MANMVDYINAKEISDLDTVYITGAGFINKAFSGISRDSAMGWNESAWSGDLTRSLDFTLENIDDVDFGKVARCEIVFPYMNITEFEYLQKLLHERHLIVNYYNLDEGKRVTQEMAITENERNKIHNAGTRILGMKNVSIKFVATNRDLTEIGSKFTVSYDANGGVGTIASEEITYSDSYTIATPNPSSFYKSGYHFSYWATSADGNGWKYLPNEKITIWENLTLYAIWLDKSSLSIGNGSENSPFEISTKEQLQTFANLINSSSTNSTYKTLYYKLTADIDLEGIEWTPIGISKTYSFNGNFNGNNHTINNLTITTKTSSDIYYGLFGYINGATIKNVGLVNEIIDFDIDIIGYSQTQINIGGISGGCNNSTIDYCYNINGLLHITNTENILLECSMYTGSIIGKVEEQSNINYCYNNSSIDCINLNSSSSVYVGGIVGFKSSNYALTISNCYNLRNLGVSGDANCKLGGIIGFNSYIVNIYSCYNIGTLIGNTGSIGGILGYNQGVASSINYCYVLSTLSIPIYTYGSTLTLNSSGNLTLSEMKNYGNYNAWDFEDVWTIDGSGNRNSGYPYLYNLGV